MSKSLKEITELFGQSTIPLEEQNDLLILLTIMPENVLEELQNTFSEDPSLIEDFYADFQAKFRALSGKSDSQLDDELSKEESENEELDDDGLSINADDNTEY